MLITVYFSLFTDDLTIPDLSKRNRKSGRRLSYLRGKLSKPEISLPMDFSHISHIGPGELMGVVSNDGVSV